MKTLKEYRFKNNPQEKVFHDKFQEYFPHLTSLEQIIFPLNNYGSRSGTITKHESDLIISVIQWLGSHVGQSFLKECGFEKNYKK